MLFRRYGTFTGGIDLPDEKRRTLNEPIRPCPSSGRLLVPTAYNAGKPADPVVAVGEAVQAGQKIAAGADGGIDVFAPLSGRVARMTRAWVADADELVQVPAVEMTNLSEPTGLDPADERWAWQAAGGDGLLQRIAESSLATFRRRALPLTVWLQAACGCRKLVVNAMEGQPMVTADHRLLAEHGGAVLAGMLILGRAIEAADLILAVDWRRTDAYQGLVAPAGQHGITRIALPHKYPIGADPILVKVLTRREIPLGRAGTAIGVAVIDAATCLAVYRAVACGCPPTARVVTLAGPGMPQPGNYWAPFGTPYGDLVGRDAAGPLIHGGPMTGLQVRQDTVVGPATNAVLALASPLPAAPSACIRCGWCTDHCPARLNVAALNDAYELKLIDEARRSGVQACVGCGTCAYVCPARLPLARRMKELCRVVRSVQEDMPLFAAGPQA